MKLKRVGILVVCVGVLLVSMIFAAPALAATQTEINDAIDDGVTWLTAQQDVGGAWIGDGFTTANTGFAVATLEHDAEKLGKAPLDPAYAHSARVQRGLDYLFNNPYLVYDSANQWVYWQAVDPFYNVYQTGPCLMAISRSGAPSAVVSAGPLAGKTYKQVAQMVVDWLGSAQLKTGNPTGAWYYRKDATTGDQSATGWVTMGLGYAAHSMGCTLPTGLLDRLALWNEFIQSHVPGPTFGGSAYMDTFLGWYNVYKTGHLLFNQGLCGLTVDAQRVQDALAFMHTHWNDLTNGAGSSNDYGWRGNPSSGLEPSYIATMAAGKGFNELGIESFSGHDWYSDFAEVIVTNQEADGHWLGGGHGEIPIRSTAWALLTLLRATSHVPPAVTADAATAVTRAGATLNGDLVDLGTAESVEVSFQYGTSSGTYTGETTAQTKNSAPAALSASITGLTGGTTYYFRVKAVGDATGYSEELSFTTPTNTDPTIDLGSDVVMAEGQTFTLAGSLTDPDVNTWTATVNYGDGTGTQNLALTGKTFSLSHLYGDNGAFTVTVSVNDGEGGTDSDSLVVTVTNVAPTVQLAQHGNWVLDDRVFFLTSTGVPVPFNVTATDPGSDDLTITYRNGTTHTYFNNGTSADPAVSPAGSRPFTVSTSDAAAHLLPGVFTDGLTFVDDDGGRVSDGATIVVRGVEQTLGDVAGWLARYSAAGAGSDKVLAGYLDVVCFFSPYLGDETLLHRTTALRGAADAAAILGAYEGGTVEEQAEALLLAAWLNWASGAEGWTSRCDTNGDGHPDIGFCLAMGHIERVLCLWTPPAADLAEALGYAKGVFTGTPEEDVGFSDVLPSDPYFDAIMGISNLGAIAGFPDGTFKPHDPVTRQQFAKMIVKALGYEVTTSDICHYVDVQKTASGNLLDPSDVLYPDHYVAVCVAKGITVGKTATTYAPYDPITRQHLISMVVRAAGLAEPPAGYTPAFTASQFALAEHYQNARKAAYAGLLDGLVGVSPAYNFGAAATRGECAQMLWAMLVD